MINRSVIKKQLAEFARVPIESLAEDRSVVEVIADSFMMIEMLLNLQEDFQLELSTEDLDGIHTVGELVDMVAGRLVPQ